MRQAMFFVGSYTQGLCPGNPDKQANGRGIDAVRLDLDTGQLSLARSNPGIANPSFVAISPDGKTLYAVNELQQYQGEESGAISAFRIASDSGALELLNSKSTHGASPCHVSITGMEKSFSPPTTAAAARAHLLPTLMAAWQGRPRWCAISARARTLLGKTPRMRTP